MAINTSWTVKIGTVASPTDFTSRVMGMQIDQDVDVNVIGRGRCVITLLNRDGALTPGGGGTYGTTDWFAQGVFVACLTNTGGADTTHQVFHGIVVDFDLQDDGVFSTVTITAIDALAVGGKSRAGTANAFATTTYTNLVAVAVLPGDTLLQFPKLGASTVTATQTWLNAENPSVLNDNTVNYDTYASFWSQSMVTSANDVFWATTITSSAGNVVYSMAGLPNTNTRSAANQTDFEFDPPGSLSGSKLPFDIDQFDQSFNNDTLITQTQIKGNYTGAATVSTQASTISTYGSRTLTLTNTFIPNATAVSAMASKLLNRYGTSRFSPTTIQTSASLVKRLASDSAVGKWRHLLDVEKGFWQRAKITWTGSGAASQTAYCVIKGRRISVTPADTVVTLSLGNWADNHSFILDTEQLNVDRLG